MFFALKDLLRTTKRQDVLLGEQTRLQEDLQERMKRLEVCQKEEEAKQQHLQALQNELEESKTELARQETVLHPAGAAEEQMLPRRSAAEELPLWVLLAVPALCDLRGISHQLFASLGINITDH